jgi:hypothetical protein
VLEFFVTINDVTICVGFYVKNLQGLNLHKVLKLAGPEAIQRFGKWDAIRTMTSTTITTNSITETHHTLLSHGHRILTHKHVTHWRGHLLHHRTSHSLLHHWHGLLHQNLFFMGEISSRIQNLLIHLSLASKEPLINQLRSVKGIPELALRMSAVKYISKFVT